MIPMVPPVPAMARICSSSRLRQWGVTELTPVWVSIRGSDASCTSMASQNPSGLLAMLPLCRKTLTSPKRRPSEPPRSLGQRLRAWRLERGLEQRDVAAWWEAVQGDDACRATIDEYGAAVDGFMKAMGARITGQQS